MDGLLSRDVEARLRIKVVEANYEIVKFCLLTPFLSPVRNQGWVGCCSHVCIVESVEMLYRICGILIDGSSLYYFDVNELFDHCFSLTSREDVMGSQGTDISIVMSFAIKNGLKLMTTCTNPRPRDLAAQFDSRVKRNRVKKFLTLTPSDVLFLSSGTPIVAGLIPYWSLRNLSQAIYDGPTMEEVENKTSFDVLHTVLIVGNTKLRRGNEIEEFVIIQNSWGSIFGLSGFAVVPFDCKNIFVKFWAPYDPIPDHDPQGIASSSASSSSSQRFVGSSMAECEELQQRVETLSNENRTLRDELQECEKLTSENNAIKGELTSLCGPDDVVSNIENINPISRFQSRGDEGKC